MNKTARVKHLAKREAEAEKAKLKEEADKAAEGAKKTKRQEEREAIVDRRIERLTRPFFLKRG